MRTIILACAAAIAVTAPAAAFETPAREFTRDGISYRYTTTKKDGVTYLTGVVLDTGKKFKLAVARDGKVKGRFGTTPVSFQADTARSDTRSLASR